jgi:RHS repeat-associated protein
MPASSLAASEGARKRPIPFGKSRSGARLRKPCAFLTGKERDSESANDYFGARYYFAGNARWLSVDAVAGRVKRPQTLNRYAYVTNDPVNFSDPDGNLMQAPNCKIVARPGLEGWDLYEVCTSDDLGGGGPGEPGDPPVPEPETRMQRGPCDFPSYAGLTDAQRMLFGGTMADWNGLASDKIAGFLNITGALAKAGIDFSGLQLQNGIQGIEQDRLFFTPGSADILKGLISASGKFTSDQPLASEHEGMSDWGFRQNLLRLALQVGGGSAGAFVDLDFWNPSNGLVGLVGHIGEVISNRVNKANGGSGLTDPIKMGKKLGWDVTNYKCK